jgi:hypothetical protein
MPQACEQLRERMRHRFGSIDARGPEKFLQDAGYTLDARWEWSKPDVTNLDDMTEAEYECLLFLVEEWDYGALKGSNSNADD